MGVGCSKMKFLGSKVLLTERLILRPVTLSDTPTMYINWQSDERVTKYLSWKPYPSLEYSYEVSKNWISRYSNYDFFLWLIVEKETNIPIGTIGIGHYASDWSSAEVGYCLGYKWWGKGYATEALKIVSSFLLNKVKIPELTCCCDRENLASARVMEKAGYKFRSVKKDFKVREDYICDILVFYMKRESFIDKIKNK